MKVLPINEIKEFIQKIADPLEIEVVDVAFKQGANPSLTVYIDKEGGVDLDACESLHRAIDEPLDELNPTFDMPYTLNVSSLGLDWAFKFDRDYIKNIGNEVDVKLYAPLMGKKAFTAKLLEYDKNCITVERDGEIIKININQIAKITRAIDF